MDDVIEHIYKNQKIIWSVCRTFYTTREDREDLFQEIVIRLWKSADTFKQRSKFSTWLYRVALNTAITHQKKTKKFDAEPLRIQTDTASFEEEQSNETDIKLLYEAIDQLNKVEKAIILLYLEDKSYEEMAEITGFTRSNISVKLVRIRKKLENIYHKMI